MVMRSRLERLEWKRAHPEEAARLKEGKRQKEMLEQGVAPPSIGSKPKQRVDKDVEMANGKGKDEQSVEESQGQGEPVAEVKPKKVSRFKAARMGN